MKKTGPKSFGNERGCIAAVADELVERSYAALKDWVAVVDVVVAEKTAPRLEEEAEMEGRDGRLSGPVPGL